MTRKRRLATMATRTPGRTAGLDFSELTV
jgi:hypothetical protein